MNSKVRVRFAPSPTGFLHIGGVRTALFNYLLARKEKGAFLLRIEDTDRERSKIEFENEILNSLTWLGLRWDEVIVRQGERLPIYQKAMEELIGKDLAYRFEEKGRTAVKFKIPQRKAQFQDLVHGPIEFDGTLLDDLVIQKSDGFPTYHFACVVDDHEMGITHVIRGDDHISNTPRQLFIYEAFGWKPPQFAHLPLVFGQDRTPLSKRHGAVSLTAYREEGYLPEGILNYLALLGWSGAEKDREIYNLTELVQAFGLDRINKTNACFDPEKFKWVNAEHIRRLDDQEYVKRLKEFISGRHSEAARHKSLAGKKADLSAKSFGGRISEILRFAQDDTSNFNQVALLYKNRIVTFKDFGEQASFFFEDKVTFDPKAAQTHLKDEKTKHYLGELQKALSDKGDFTDPKVLEEILRKIAERLGVEARALIHPVRVAISGRSVTPSLFEVMALLGKEVVLRRIQYAIINFNVILSKASAQQNGGSADFCGGKNL